MPIPPDADKDMKKAIDVVIQALSDAAPEIVFDAAKLAHRISDLMADGETTMDVAELALFFLLRFCFERNAEHKEAKMAAHVFTDMVQ